MTPKYQILADDRDITSAGDNFKRLLVTDKIGLVTDTADISLYFDGSFEIPRVGVPLEIRIGSAETGLWQVEKFIGFYSTLTVLDFNPPLLNLIEA